jgi:hypothetical protein
MLTRSSKLNFSKTSSFLTGHATAVQPYELEISFFFVFVLTGVYIAYSLVTTPRGGHPFGQWLGIIGALLMLMTEILYTLRKRTRWLNWAGPLRYWLSLHIVTGIVGPFLVLMHTGLQFRGLAGVSFLLTVIVVASGFIGRYIYTALPRSIHGAAASAQLLDEEIAAMTAIIDKFQGREGAQERQILSALQQRSQLRRPLLSLVGRNFYQWRYERKLQHELNQLQHISDSQRRTLRKLLSQKRERERQRDILAAARSLLRLWHILHIPFGMTLFFSMFLHILATIYFRAGIFS